jgi:hypothetical protein
VKDGDIRLVAIAVAVAVHGALLGAVYGFGHLDKQRAEKRADESKVNHIQAGLAIKAKSTSGRKSKQPQKDVATRDRPSDVAVTRDDSAPPDKKDPKKKDEEIDPEAAMAKARKLGQTSEDPPPDTSSEQPGGDDENQKGRTDGHEFGLLDSNEGDPYLGELAGRMQEHYEVPTNVPEGTGLTAWGCVSLNPDGTVRDAKVDPEHRSANATFNSAVLRTVKQTSNMPSAVPKHLKEQLVEGYQCVEFKH